MGLVYSIVKRFAGRGYDSEELSQIGAIGLIKAVDKFDLRFDVRFSTYAVPLITGEIKRFLRDDGMVRVSRSIKENSWRVKRMAAELSQKLEREPSMDELSAAVELPVLRRKNTEGNCGTSGNQPGSSQSPGEKTAFTDARKNCWKKISKKY